MFKIHIPWPSLMRITMPNTLLPFSLKDPETNEHNLIGGRKSQQKKSNNLLPWKILDVWPNLKVIFLKLFLFNFTKYLFFFISGKNKNEGKNIVFFRENVVLSFLYLRLQEKNSMLVSLPILKDHTIKSQTIL